MYYHQLSRENAEIRLMRPLCLAPSEPVSDFEMSNVSLNFLPPYQAISYSWGSPMRAPNITPFAITINGTRRYISSNLQFVLEQIHTVSSSDTWLWIDALCINMEDQNERNWQVAQMHNVFASADSVLFCMGPAANDSDYLFDLLRSFGWEAVDVGIYPGHGLFFNDTHEDATFPNLSPQAQRFIRRLVLAEKIYGKRLHDAIDALSRRPHWKRCWIIQELALAKRGILVCGDNTIELHHFYAIMRALGRVRAWRGNLPPVGDDCYFTPSSAYNAMLGVGGQMMCVGQEMVSMKLSTTLHWFLTHWASTRNAPGLNGPFYQATDPRDVVFALLGAASDRVSLGIHVDYSKTTRDVYTEATVAMFRGDAQRVILELASFPKDIGGLPTWVPDWSRIGRLGTQEPISYDSSFYLFQSPKTMTDLTILNGYILQRYGYVCGVVRRALRLFDSSHNTEQQAAALSCALQHDRVACVEDMLEFMNLYAPDVPEDSNETVETRLWRTITTDYRRNTTMSNGSTLLDGYHECCGSLLRRQPIPARDLSALAIAWMQIIPEAGEDESSQGQVDAFVKVAQDRALELTRNRTLFVTEDGRVGLGPYLTQPGDVVTALVGNTVPTLLRPDPAGCAYQYLGQAFVEDMMEGQLDQGEHRYQVFNLV
ncbi:HET domain [Cordyceps militaris]|uniref:HET domain n=1 Tax=Cordyceps militaris TaxID=73501 RepID=A0A2H4SG49_CORMI|nr:HET domain [Cordyceps militaris]